MMSEKTKRYLSGLAISLALLTTATGLWISFFSGQSTLTITDSSDPLVYTSYLDVNTISLTGCDESINTTDTVNVTNSRNNANVTVEYSVTRTDTDLEDGCSFTSEDVDVNVYPLTFSLAKDQTQIVTVDYVTNCWSCNGNVTVDMNMTAIKV